MNLQNHYQNIFTNKQKMTDSFLSHCHDFVNSTHLPTKKDELWRYTPIQDFLKEEYKPIKNAHSKFPAEKFLSGARIVFIDGIFSEDHSLLPEGIVLTLISDLNVNEQKIRADIKNKFSLDLLSLDPLSAYNQLANNGILIYVPANTIIEQALQVIYWISNNETKILSTPQILIQLEKSSQMTLIENFQGEETHYWQNALLQVQLKENSHFKHLKYQNESNQAFHYSRSQFSLEKDAQLNTINLISNGSLVRQHLDVLLNGPGAHVTSGGLFVLEKNQHGDNYSQIHHLAPHTTSEQIYKGVVSDESHGVFWGKVFVHKEAQKTNATQLNKNIILSAKATIDTQPQLEIQADDVKCGHGATIGQLSEDEIFYLSSRGIPPKRAKELLALGFAAEILNMITTDSEIKDWFNSQFNQKIRKII